jgi:hypothetical protein
MAKIDYLKMLKHLYGPSAKKVEIIDVPEMNFLMIDGEGDPNTAQAFKDAAEALFSLSYTLKFMVKKGEMGIDMACCHFRRSGGPMTLLLSALEIKTPGNGP